MKNWLFGRDKQDEIADKMPQKDSQVEGDKGQVPLSGTAVTYLSLWISPLPIPVSLCSCLTEGGKGQVPLSPRYSTMATAAGTLPMWMTS